MFLGNRTSVLYNFELIFCTMCATNRSCCVPTFLARMTMPAEDMEICHMGDRYWKMVESEVSSFGKLAHLQSVWWMDVITVIHGVPPGRYKVQWRVKVTSEAPIINTDFRAVILDKNEVSELEPFFVHSKHQSATCVHCLGRWV